MIFLCHLCALFLQIQLYKAILNAFTVQNMETFGKKLRECRERNQLSQSALAKELGAHHSIIGRYERDEVKPTIDVIKNLAKILNTSAAFLLGESQDSDILQNPQMLKRLNDINALAEKDKECILYAIDGLIRDAKTRQAYAS